MRVRTFIEQSPNEAFNGAYLLGASVLGPWPFTVNSEPGVRFLVQAKSSITGSKEKPPCLARKLQSNQLLFLRLFHLKGGNMKTCGSFETQNLCRRLFENSLAT